FHRPVSQTAQGRSKLGGDFHCSRAPGPSESPNPADERHFVCEIGEQWVGRVERRRSLGIELQAVGSIRRGKRPRAVAQNLNGLTCAGRQINGRFSVEIAVPHERNLRHSINGVAKDSWVGGWTQGKCVSRGHPNGRGVYGRSIVRAEWREADDQRSRCQCDAEGSKQCFHRFPFLLGFSALRRVIDWARGLVSSSNWLFMLFLSFLQSRGWLRVVSALAATSSNRKSGETLQGSESDQPFQSERAVPFSRENAWSRVHMGNSWRA